MVGVLRHCVLRHCLLAPAQHGVVCGNEAVWTVEDSDGPLALLGMDLVRWMLLGQDRCL